MDSVQIGFQLLFFMACLVVLGEPWRGLLKRTSGFFESLDYLEILILDVFLGGFLLYVIAIVPFGLFTPIILYLVTFASLVTIIWSKGKKFVTSMVNWLPHPRKLAKRFFGNYRSIELLLVALLFLLSFAIQTLPFSNLLLGSVRDTSLHSLFVKVTIENAQVPLTLEPYLDEGIVYPQGFTPTMAYSVFLLGYSPPQAVFFVTALFNALAVLGAYFLGKALSEKDHLGLILSFVFVFVAFWPKYITWGSNALVASFPLFFVCLGLLPYLAREKLNLTMILATGALFGYLSVLHLQTYEVLIASLFMLWLYILLKKRKDAWRRFGGFAAIFCASLLVLSPFIYRVFSFYQYPMHNIGTAGDIQVVIPQLGLPVLISGLQWLGDHLASNIVYKAVTLVIFVISCVTIVAFRKKNDFKRVSPLVIVGIAALLGEMLLFALAAVLPPDFPVYPHPMLLYFPFYFFAAAFILIFHSSFINYLPRRIHGISGHADVTRKVTAVSILSILLLLGVFSPFLYQGFAVDSSELYASYATFAVTTPQDLQLISWAHDNLPQNATILVNTFQSGTFIPSLANRKVVFPSFGSSASASYQSLVAMLESEVLNKTTFDLMDHFGITDVYLGSGVSPWNGGVHQWDPKLFLGNPRFGLLKNFGSAYLFHRNLTDTDTVFFDDFEHLTWDENGWTTRYSGNGVANATSSNVSAYLSETSLRISSQAVFTASQLGYSYSVIREFHVCNESEIALSFYLNATDGFNGKDTVAFFVTNIGSNASIIISTPHGAYSDYNNTITLSGFEGFFNFDLSAEWLKKVGSSLPGDFNLEMVNYDFDGIENIAFIGNIQIVSTAPP